MCGIAAIIHRDARPATGRDAQWVAPISAMAARLRHRGPDAVGSATLSGCDLGHTRLSIIDLAGGAQPMSDEHNRFWVTFNGEIYNYRDLRKELEGLGRPFRTSSDTEVLLRAYQQWGERCVERLNGQFAFVAWDDRERSALCARDRMGEKPLYWAKTATGGIALASEIKALLAGGVVAPRLDRGAVDAFLALLYVPPDRTIYSNVHTVPPGGAMAWRDGHLREWRYWEPSLSTNPSLDAQTAAAEVRRLVEQAVQRQMVADVPVGAFLSGGLDSSTIVALMSRHTAHPVKTFSVGFGGLINELPYARAVAETYRTEHHELQVDMPLADLVRQMAAVYDEPLADSSNLPTYLMSEFAARTVKVALAGDGGDELFGGYAWYLPLLAGMPVGGRERSLAAATLRHLGWRLAAGARLSVRRQREAAGRGLAGARLRRRHADVWQRHLANSTLIGLDRAALWGGGVDGSERAAQAAALLDAGYRPGPGTSAMDRAVDFDLRCYLPGDILVKVDRAAMAHALETRAPFLDRELVEFVLSVPWPARFEGWRGGQLKPLLHRACDSLWPNEIRGRPKQGFGAPIQAWIGRPEIRALLAQVSSPSAALPALLPGAPARIAALLDLATIGRLPWHEAQMGWSLLCLGLWLEAHEGCLNASADGC